MKASLASFAGVLALAAGVSWAQGPSTATQDPAAADTWRHDIQQDKRGVVEKTLELTPTEAKRFWPLYDRYQHDLDRIIDRQNRAVLEFVGAESSMTNANAKRLALEMLNADADEQRLREKQLRKFLTVLPAKKAVRYMQIENRIRTGVRYDIAERLPLAR
jgi:Spy/CpxP family protein refolding chaperone